MVEIFKKINNILIKYFVIFVYLLFVFISYYNFPFSINNITLYNWKTYKESRKLYIYYKLCNKGILLKKLKSRKVLYPKISIISPIYNREKYIIRFLRSIQNQFFNDIEIILVDDFSKDNSVKLIEEYQKEDERIILIKNNKNKGTLISRNNGILFSKGEYIIIPDPDDILSKDILDKCYEISKKYNFEMIRFNILEKDSNNIFFDFFVNNLESRPIYQPELTGYLFYGLGVLQQIDFNVSNKFIKRIAYIRALNIINIFYLNQYMTNLEDGIMNYILYRTVKSFYFLKTVGYYYIQNNQSITIKPTINYDEKMRFIFLHLKIVFETTKNNKYEKDMTNSLFKRLYNLLKDDFYLIKKDFNFYLDIINIYLNCKFINEENRLILNELKTIINKTEKLIMYI